MVKSEVISQFYDEKFPIALSVKCLKTSFSKQSKYYDFSKRRRNMDRSFQIAVNLEENISFVLHLQDVFLFEFRTNVDNFSKP